ncbi:hypothetical protein CDN98_12600 [Roseateles terrae]|nr:hypothetical protein CDN98_12600 [Roseateles terrae]
MTNKRPFEGAFFRPSSAGWPIPSAFKAIFTGSGDNASGESGIRFAARRWPLLMLDTPLTIGRSC